MEASQHTSEQTLFSVAYKLTINISPKVLIYIVLHNMNAYANELGCKLIDLILMLSYTIMQSKMTVHYSSQGMQNLCKLLDINSKKRFSEYKHLT